MRPPRKGRLAMARRKTGKQLEAIAKMGDMKYATRVFWTMNKYTSGQVWSFWMEDDPRIEDGIVPVSRFRCTKSGGDDSEWVEIK